MKLSENFSLKEFTRSHTATRLGLDNIPNDDELANLEHLVENICQPSRDHYGKPARVTSGYRSPELNRVIGGSQRSQHSHGEAVDYEIPGIDNKELAIWISENCEYDQIILEFYDEEEGGNSGWVHASLRRDGANRKMKLNAVKRNGKTFYETANW